eukprot:GFUD01003974.1.p1 GENE.GFUD01003974.1~~GFUD01003974.1.p1  ORF type:complete len:410 (+),score=127.13 GFUD01003974.1:104-1231(+)
MFDLPIEIVQHIVSYLSLQDICHLGATCRHGHSLTHDDYFWEFQVRKQFGLYFTADLSKVTEALTKSSHYPLEGVAYDPTVQGNREISVIYSPEFRRIMIERKGKAKQDPFRGMKDILPRLLAFYVSSPEEQFSARLALFGPGIESTNTKLLVHKIVNARSSTFDAVEFIKGLPGGIGSGVRINYKHMYNFDLMCLYSNSESIRESVYLHRSTGRLDPELNRMLVKDSSGKLVIQPYIVKLLPTLHALVFAVDTAVDSREKVAEEVEGMRKELEVMLESQSKFHLSTPLLVLACRNESVGANYFITLQEIVEGLQLMKMKSPWGVFEVCCVNIRGAEKGLDWVLHHLAKRRRVLSFQRMHAKEKRELNYHRMQGH